MFIQKGTRLHCLENQTNQLNKLVLIGDNNGNNDSVEIKRILLLKKQPDITT